MKKATWIPEAEAARMINYRPTTLRRYAKWGRIPINYTTNNGRRFQYAKEDIEKYLVSNSTLIN